MKTISCLSRSITAFGLLSFAVLLVGCGGSSDQPDLGYVSGKVTIDGEPAPNLQVAFQPETGRPAVGETNENGEYSLQYSASAEGSKVGPNVVRITTIPEDTYEAHNTEEDADEFEEPLPARYNAEAADNPEMNVEIKPGSNTFNFDLKSE